MASIRYIVNDVDRAIAFYTEHGGFSSKQAGIKFRNEIVVGPGGKQILAEDPDGNPVEFFEPAS